MYVVIVMQFETCNIIYIYYIIYLMCVGLVIRVKVKYYVKYDPAIHV